MFAVCAVYASTAAKASPKPDSQAILWYLWTVLILMAMVLAAALVIVFVGRWIERPSSGLSISGDDLSSFRVLYERGEFSQEEYDRIRAGLGKRLRQEVDVPAQPPAEPPAATAPPGNTLPAATPDPTIARTIDPGNGAPDHANKPE